MYCKRYILAGAVDGRCRGSSLAQKMQQTGSRTWDFCCPWGVRICCDELRDDTSPKNRTGCQNFCTTLAKHFFKIWFWDFAIFIQISDSDDDATRTFTGLLVGYSLAGAFSATTLGGYNIAKRWNGMPIYASNKGAKMATFGKSGSDLQKRIYHEKWNTLWQLTKHLVPFIPYCCGVQYPKIASVKTRCLDIGLCILYNTKTHNKNNQEPNGLLSR